jgi:uncharacterized iron-regulated membrane protein
MKPFLRKQVRLFHTYSAFTVGVVLISMAITGSILAFRSQLEPLVYPKLLTVEQTGPRLSYDLLVSKALSAHPSSQLDYIRYFSDPNLPFLVRFTNKDFIHINPYTGEVLGIRNRYGHFFGWIEGFHRFLMLDPKIGEPLIGYVSIFLFIISITGIIIVWPATRKALVATLKINRKLGQRPLYLNVHRTIGLYASVVLLLISITGAPQALEWVKHSLFLATSSHVETIPKGLHTSSTTFIGMNALASSVDKLVAKPSEVLIHFPDSGIAEAFAIASDAPHPNARSYIWFNSTNGSIVKYIPYAKDAMGRKLALWALSIHTGQFGGIGFQLVLFSGALSILILALSGIRSYLLRKSR